MAVSFQFFNYNIVMWDFFCTAEFLCYQGSPNWFGWLTIIFILVFALNLFLGVTGWYPKVPNTRDYDD